MGIWTWLKGALTPAAGEPPPAGAASVVEAQAKQVPDAVEGEKLLQAIRYEERLSTSNARVADTYVEGFSETWVRFLVRARYGPKIRRLKSNAAFLAETWTLLREILASKHLNDTGLSILFGDILDKGAVFELAESLDFEIPDDISPLSDSVLAKFPSAYRRQSGPNVNWGRMERNLSELRENVQARGPAR